MSRNANVSRVQPTDYERLDREERDFQRRVRKYRLRRGGPQRRIQNVIHATRSWYAFLEEVEDYGVAPCYARFELLDRQWFDYAVARLMPNHYDIRRLLTVLDGRDYWTAWEDSIGGRVVLRRIHDAYVEVLVDHDAPLASYEVALYPEHLWPLTDPEGQAGPTLRAGFWYELVLRQSFNAPSVEGGMLAMEDPATGRFGDPTCWTIASLYNLRRQAWRLGDFMFGPYSQAVLQALNFARGM